MFWRRFLGLIHFLLLFFSCSFLCQRQGCFNEWSLLLLMAAACLQLWMKLSGAFGTVPVFGLSFLQEADGAKASALDALDVDWWTADSLPFLQKNTSAFLICIDRNPWKPNVCVEWRGVRGWWAIGQQYVKWELLLFWCQCPSLYLISNVFLLSFEYNLLVCYMLEYVTTLRSNVNSASTWRLLCPLYHCHQPSDSADRQNTLIILSLRALLVCLKLYKSCQASTDVT